MKTIRVFPSRTKATPTGADVRFGPPGLWDTADHIEVSVTFSWDIPRAEELARQWEQVAPVEMGGPALGASGGDFVPGRYHETHNYAIELMASVQASFLLGESPFLEDDQNKANI